MISLIFGKIVSNTGTEVVAMTAGGVGYKIAVCPSAAQKWPVGKEAEILTFLVVREDAMDLYGFASEKERALFLQFLSVSGIGPKSALHILGLGSVDEIAGAIGRGDVEYLTRVSGVGKKTAERVVMELKNKVGALGEKDSARLGGAGDALGDVVKALLGLGYSASEARAAVKGLDAAGKGSEQLLKEALREMK